MIEWFLSLAWYWQALILVYPVGALVVGGMTLWQLWDYNAYMAVPAALKMGLGWPYWAFKFIF